MGIISGEETGESMMQLTQLDYKTEYLKMLIHVKYKHTEAFIVKRANTWWFRRNSAQDTKYWTAITDNYKCIPPMDSFSPREILQDHSVQADVEIRVV